jgi:hypothetical protein
LDVKAPDGIDVPLYVGNYSTSKLLLNRLSWNVNDSSIKFADFTVRTVYRAMLSDLPQTLSAITKWEAKLSFPLSHVWANMISYLHDPNSK